MNANYKDLEAKIALLEVQLKLSEAAERAWESSMMHACGEDGPKSVADKFAELESKLETALRECRYAGITIDNLEAKCAALAADNEKAMEAMKQADAAVKLAHEKFSALAAENAGLNKFIKDDCWIWDDKSEEYFDAADCMPETPATDAFLAEVRAQGVEMYADNLDNVAGDAERGGFDYAVKFLRSEASSVSLFADQLRKGGNQ